MDMDEVYRARDTKLDRDVALKMLPGPFSGDLDPLVVKVRENGSMRMLVSIGSD